MPLIRLKFSFFLFIVFFLFAAKTKRLKDEQKTSEMNEFVNNYMCKLTDEEKKLPFITNHARALKAYQQVSNIHLM